MLNEIESKQGNLFWQINKAGDNKKSNQKIEAMAAIQNYLLENDKKIDGYSSEDLINKLYNDIFEYSILTDPLEDIWIEQVNVNAWNDVRVRLTNGRSIKAESFTSPRKAKEKIERLLKESGISPDSSFIYGRLKEQNARILVLKPPVIPENQTIRCAIKKSVNRNFTANDYQSGGFAVTKELKFINTAICHGLSILITGCKSSGKTSFLKYFVSSLPDTIKCVTVGQGQREIGNELLLSEEQIDGFISGTACAGSDIAAFNFQTWAAQKASLYVPAVIAQSVGTSPIAGIENAAFELIKKYPNYKMEQAYEITCRAFPIVVFLRELTDRKKRILSISECTYENRHICLHSLWKYEVQNTAFEDTGVKITGHHKQAGIISGSLINRMELYGITPEEIEFLKEDKSYAGSTCDREACSRPDNEES